ncbi:MAG TPA: TetR/AcrR family transcriptional regulator [Acidimicrobiales bacterium]|nr:TetR/AcrR family transcriptional regulator [Acidimicrobiales bacterium]
MARPRSEEAHRAALDATLELLLEAGVEGVTVEEVAARSGVAKSTLYRHFTTRENLIAQAARCCVVEHPTPDTGSLAGDLRYLFGRFSESEGEKRLTDLMPLLIDAAKRDPGLEELVTSVLAERKRPIRTVLQLAQLRGEVSPDLDLDTALAMVIGPFSYRRLVERREATPEFIEAVLTGAIAALRATAALPDAASRA